MKKQFVLKSVPVSFVHDSEYDRLVDFAREIRGLKEGFANYLLDHSIDLDNFTNLEGFDVISDEKEYAFYHLLQYLGKRADKYLLTPLRPISHEVWYSLREHQSRLADKRNEFIEVADELASGEVPEFLKKKYRRHKGENKVPVLEYWIEQYDERIRKIDERMNCPPSFEGVYAQLILNSQFWYEDYEGHFKCAHKAPYKASVYKIKINKIVKSETPTVLTIDMNDYLKGYWHRYEKGNPTLYFSNGEFLLGIPFRIAEKTNLAFDKIPENTIIVGIDVGITNSVSTSTGRQYNNSKLESICNRTRKRRRECQRKSKSNKNRYKVRQHLFATKEKQAELQKHKVYNMANLIVADLKRDLDGKDFIVAIERLKGLSKNMGFERKHLGKHKHLKRRMNWAYDLFFGALKDRLATLGIHVYEVYPSYTSQADSRGFDGGERRGKFFKCADGRVLDADINGANNIARKFARKKGVDRNFTLAFSPQRGIMKFMKIQDRPEEKGYLDLLFKRPKKADVL